MLGFVRSSLGLTGMLLLGSVGCSAGAASAPEGQGGDTTMFGAGGYLTSAGGAPVALGGATAAPGGSGPGAGGTTTAASGGVPGAGGIPSAQGAGGGPAVPFAGYDATIKFDWPESVPTAGSCKPGKYSGTFTGWYAADLIAGFPVPIAGNVDLTLLQSDDGEFFKLADGKISGLVYGFIPFDSGLTGTLDCGTLKLVDGFMPKGKYNLFGTDYPYEGPLDADYDKLTNAFVNGKWIVGEPTYHRGDPSTQFGGFGDWGVNYTGP